MEQSTHRLLSSRDIQDIWTGSTVLAAGGGGHLSESKPLIDAVIAADRQIPLRSIDDVPSDTLLCTAYNLSSVSTSEIPFLNTRDNHEAACVKAVRIMQEKVGKISGLFPVEIGAVSIATVFYIASKIDGVFVLDADPIGRSVPEVPHTLSALDRAGLPASPIVAVTDLNETLILENVANTTRTEKILRALSAIEGKRVAGVHHALPTRELRPCLIPNTVSKALEMGRIMREASARQHNAAQVIAERYGGIMVLHGIVSNFCFEEKRALTIGYIELQGVQHWEGNNARIDVRNENMVLRVNNEVKATIPDIINVFDQVKNEAVLNPNYRIGMDVVVVVLPASEALTSKAALDAFGPAYIGLSEPFKSITRR